MKDTNTKTAKEIIDHFFSQLEEIPDMDQKTTLLIQKLWMEDRLGRDELLSELVKSRSGKGNNDPKED